MTTDPLLMPTELHCLAWLVAWGIHDAQQEVIGLQPYGRGRGHLARARDVVDGLALAYELAAVHDYDRWRLACRLQDWSAERRVDSYRAIAQPLSDRMLLQAVALQSLSQLLWDRRVHGEFRTSRVIEADLASARLDASRALRDIDICKSLRRHTGLAQARREWLDRLRRVENLTIELREQERREARR